MPKIIADGTEYEVPTFNLGEFRLLKREFGVERVDRIDPQDPDHLVGMLFVVARRKDPAVTIEAIEAVCEVEFVNDDPETAKDPSEASASSTEDAPGAGVGGDGASGTTPASSGPPTS